MAADEPRRGTNSLRNFTACPLAMQQPVYSYPPFGRCAGRAGDWLHTSVRGKRKSKESVRDMSRFVIRICKVATGISVTSHRRVMLLLWRRPHRHYMISKIDLIHQFGVLLSTVHVHFSCSSTVDLIHQFGVLLSTAHMHFSCSSTTFHRWHQRCWDTGIAVSVLTVKILALKCWKLY